VSFSCVAGDCTTDLSGQLSLQVIGDKNGEDTNVYFKFFNSAVLPSSVTLISFENLAGLTFLHPIANSNPLRGTGAGTEFALAFHGPANAVPDTLPGGKGLQPPFTESWTARAVAQGAGGNGQPANGINGANEAFELIASDANHPDYLTFLHAIQQGDIRVGLHVTALQGGGSATYLSAVPEPATYALLLAGLVAVGAFVRRRGE
jgi:hypothetical protein